MCFVHYLRKIGAKGLNRLAPFCRRWPLKERVPNVEESARARAAWEGQG